MLIFKLPVKANINNYNPHTQNSLVSLTMVKNFQESCDPKNVSILVTGIVEKEE